MSQISNLKITKIEDRGTLASEYVLIKVNSDTDLQNYALVDSTYTEDGSISNDHRHFYKFYHQNVNKGDFIKLYTKIGRDTQYSNKAKSTTYEYYWGLKTPVWNNDGDLAILFAISGWETFEVK